MNHQPRRDDRVRTVSYRIPISITDDQQLRQLARLLGHVSPSAYLRSLVNSALTARSNQAVAVDARESDPAESSQVQATTANTREHRCNFDSFLGEIRQAAIARRDLGPILAEIRDGLMRLEAVGHSPHPSTAPSYDPRPLLVDIHGTLRHLDAVTKATLRQSTAAAYMASTVWRLLADEQTLPQSGLPAKIIDDIESLHERILAKIERELAT